MLFLSCRTTWNLIEIGPWMTRQYSLITVSIERGVTENEFWIWINRFGILGNKALWTPDKTLLVVMASFVFHNLPILKSRDSYSTKCSFDKIESNGPLLKSGWHEKSSSNKIASSGESSHEKTKFKCQKKFEHPPTLLEYALGAGHVPLHLKVIIH